MNAMNYKIFIFLNLIISSSAIAEDGTWRVEAIGGIAAITDTAISPNVYYTGYNIIGPPTCTPWDCLFPTEPFTSAFTRPGHTNLGISASAGAAIWKDYRNLAFGAEYVWLKGSAKRKIGDSLWGRRTSEGHVQESTEVHAVLANIATRFPSTSRLTPYIGAGAGIGWRSTKFSYSADYDHDRFDAPMLPWPSPTPATRALSGGTAGVAYQIFAGVDLSLSERTYIGVRGSWFGLYASDSYYPDELFTSGTGATTHLGTFRAVATAGIKF